ncbi:CvpA family protein [Pleionea mediterranea]|uniref:Uncharacterized protein DUF4124 n=1 Tax=Pleionea mediterranea TaxID=523701 RepID=A0A316G1J5_9GAMM|nr:CvpA family protein [Pleionea mediterranea]PWK54255.1 uncharacterized protein DUF4124 [Pleionea mediterranea]
MSVFTLVFLICVGLFIFQGYRKGIAKLSFRLLGLAGAYISALLFTPNVGSWLNEQTSLNGLLGYLVAGVVIFAITSFVLDLIFSAIYKAVSSKQPELSQISRITGAVLGGVIGSAVGVLLVWIISLGNELLNQAPSDDAMSSSIANTSANTASNTSPNKSHSGTAANHLNSNEASLSLIEQFSKRITGSLIKTAVTATTDQPEMASLTARLMESPKATIHHVRSLTESPDFRELFLSSQNQSILNSGDVYRIQQIPAFRRLINNPHFKVISKELAQSDQDSPFDQQMAVKIRDIWARAKFVEQDPQSQAIINDPQLRGILQSGNIVQLMNSQKIADLFERLTSEEANQYTNVLRDKAPAENLTRTTVNSVKSSKIYKWVDKHGRVHYSDKKPEQDQQ